jgi:hypothetical protein
LAKPEVETMILRFRDLSTEPGGTIKSHSAKIDEHGFTWWGWWNKAGEKVPTGVFSELTKKAAQDALSVYLFDSGRDEPHVFKATCKEVFWRHDLEPSQSPDAEATPSYYQPRAYKAWFKLSSISAIPLDPSVLQEWSYERVDDFFESTQSRYDQFYGKRVHSTEELRQQDRTIWFVRKFREGDATHEISLLDSLKISPSDFPHEFRVSNSRHFLWLSDLHFSMDDHHGFPDKSDDARNALWQAIEDALKNKTVVGDDVSSIAGVLMSGDFTWKATGGIETELPHTGPDH